MSTTVALPDDAIDLQNDVLMRVGKALAPHGWRTEMEGDDSGRWRLTRERGAIRQRLSFGIYMSGGIAVVYSKDPGEPAARELRRKAQINPFLGFSSESVGEMLRKLLPEDAAHLDALRSEDARFREDMTLGIRNVFAHARHMTPDWVHDMAEASEWVEGFCRWYAERAAKPLDDCRDLASLNRLVHTAWSMREPGVWTAHHMLATLVVVRLCDDPSVPFMDWLGVVRRMQVEAYRWKCDDYRDHPERYESVPTEVVRNAILERLIERLRQGRPAGT